MTPERWRQIKEVFNLALEYEPAQRSSIISNACNKDEALQKEVELLLAAHEKDGSFIDSPAYKTASELLDESGELRSGEVIGSYEIKSFIGRGGMGEVYLALDKRLRRNVALKLLPSTVTKDQNRLQRFEQEARAASALNHPNIIAIYEISEVSSTLMMATEFVDGETLRQHLNGGPLNLTEVLSISIQIADALSAAHKAGIIHRDIKPENIMIRPDGYVKVLDFGLAKLAEHKSVESIAEASTKKIKTGSGIVIGTIGYMSPEQARGQTVDARSDIFNLGTLIYEMVSGQRPFNGETASDSLAAILKTEPPPLSSLAPDVPVELARIVIKALRKDREERYQGVKDLLLDLKSLKEEIDFQAKLDRSVARPTTDLQDGQRKVTVSVQAQPETSEFKTAVSTITQSLSVELKRHKVGVFLVVSLAAILMIAGGFALSKFLTRRELQTSDAPQVLKTTQLTFSPSLDIFPSLSPDGKSLVYSSDQSGNFEIYIKQVSAGGVELQLTNDGLQNLQPSWSPDGQRIAYYSKKRGGIWVVSALGGGPRQITESGIRPMWSPDGSLIAFQSSPGELWATRTVPPSTIWIVSADGGTPKQITQPGNPSGGHSSPSWSPDGKRIAFDVSNFIFGSVWTIALDGTGPKKIVDGSDPIYSADGGYLYFAGGQNGGSDLLRIRVSPRGEPIGEPATVLAAGPGTFRTAPTISRDGKRIVYSVDRFASNLWTIPISPNGDTAGTPSIFLPDASQRNNLPRFSPDGRKIALNRWRPGVSADIWVADADGKNLRQVTNNPSADSQASWLPGGDKLAFLSDRDNKYLALWTISLTTGREELLLDLGEGVEFATVSPDGNYVAYNLTQNGAMNVWIAGVHDHQRRQLTFDSQAAGFPCWSPDGKWIAYEEKRSFDDQLMLIRSTGGEPIQLTSDKGKSWPHSFSPDGNKIVFAGQRDGIWNIYSLTINTKVQKRLTNYSKLNGFVRYPAWSPNQIVYENVLTTGNIWMLELK